VRIRDVRAKTCIYTNEVSAIEIATLDIKSFATIAVNEVFDTMLSMEVEYDEADTQVTLAGDRIVGSVSFAGTIVGNISIQMSQSFGRVMTAAMLGMEEDEIEDEEDVHDVVGEMSNMIGGNLKSRFCDAGLSCELSIPSITSGSDFKVECRDWALHQRLGFHHQEHTIFVEVCIKEG